MDRKDKVITAVAIALVASGAAFLVLDREGELHPHGAAPTSLNIRVLDEKTGKPVDDSWVLVKTPQPATGYTDSQGLVAVPLKGATQGKTEVTVSAPGYEQQSVQIPTGNSSALNQVMIRPKATVSADTNIREVRSPPMLSGAGASFSPWYETCSADVPEGKAISTQSSFTLVGDPQRSCGAWAECRQKIATPARLCWEFRVQGYSERPFPGQTKVQGVLRYELVPAQQQERLQPRNGLVYIQFSGAEHREEMARLRSRFLARGISAPGIELIDKPFKPTVRYFRPSDLELAEQVAAIAQEYLNSGRSHGIRKLALELVPGYGSRSRPGTIELWLPLSSKEYATQAH